MFTPKSGPELPISGDPQDVPELTPPDGTRAVIGFGTGSTLPDDAALDRLVSTLLWAPRDVLIAGHHVLTITGHASCSGDDEANQALSEQRADFIRGRVEFLLGVAFEHYDFAFFDDLVVVRGLGETRATEQGRSPNDDLPADRVVDVVFERRYGFAPLG